MKKLLVLVISLLSVAASSGAESPARGHYEVSQVPPGILSPFIESATSNTVWRVDPELAGLPHIASAAERLVWAGSDLKTEVILGNPTIQFTKEATETEEESSFSLTIQFEKGRVVLNSSAPDPRYAAGVALPFSVEEPYRNYIAGDGDTGFVVLIPKMVSSDWYGIAVCPRDFINDKTDSRKRSFVTTSYKIDSVQVPVKGSIKGKQRTGSYKGEIHAKILTSNNTPRSTPVEHSVVIDDPSLSLEYFADKSDTDADSTLQSSVGIQLTGTLTAPSGDHRNKVTEAFVQTVPFKITQSVPFVYEGNSYSLDAGECFAIIRGVLFEERYWGKSLTTNQPETSSASSENPTE